MSSEEVLPPHNVPAPCLSHLSVGLGKHGSESRNKIPAQLKSNGNLLTVMGQDFIPHCHLKIKSDSKNRDLNDSNNIGTVQKRLKPKYKSALALNSQLEENECKFVINWLKSQITFSKKIKKKKLNYLYH